MVSLHDRGFYGHGMCGRQYVSLRGIVCVSHRAAAYHLDSNVCNSGVALPQIPASRQQNVLFRQDQCFPLISQWMEVRGTLF